MRPLDDHEMAAVRDEAQPGAQEFIEFLGSPEMTTVFESHGFRIVRKP